MSDFDHILPLTSRTEEDGQEFGIGQAGRTSGKEPFAWAIFRSQGK